MEEIMQYFSTLQGYVYIANKQGLFNINRFSEDFFCGLLNIIEDLNLLNVNNFKMNFPAIDLGDKEKRVCYQITSENEMGKIKETIRKFVEKELYNEYNIVKILIIGEKARYRTNVLKYGTFEFYINKDVLDLGDLVAKIETLNKDLIKKVLDYIKTNFDKSILNKISELSIDKNLLKPEEVNEAFPFSYYAYGLGKVRIDAYLPIKISDTISCLLNFAQDNISGCNITFNEEVLQKGFFSDYNKKLDERGFFVYQEKNSVCVDFPNIRFTTDVDTANQIAIIIDKLFEKYKEKKKRIVSLIGADNFSEVDKGKYKILIVTRDVWRMMYNFSTKHDYFTGESEWDIFNPQSINNRIMIYKNHKETLFKADVLANLIGKKVDEDYIEVIWGAGYTYSLNENEGFNNKQKWRVDYTHDWLVNEFIPYLLYLGNKEKRKIFRKAVTFGQYKNQLKIEEFGVKSLKK